MVSRKPRTFLQNESPSNAPEKMKRFHQGIQFHHKDHALPSNNSKHATNILAHHYNSHELDAKAMKIILAELFAKTLDTKMKQKENPHHHYEGTYVESDNIDKPPAPVPSTPIEKPKPKHVKDDILKTFETTLKERGVINASLDGGEIIESHGKLAQKNQTNQEEFVSNSEEEDARDATSGEVFREVLERIGSLGHRGKKVLKRLMDEIEKRGPEGEGLRQVVNKTMNDQTLSEAEKRRRRRDLILSSPLRAELTEDDEDEDAAIEEVNFIHSYPRYNCRLPRGGVPVQRNESSSPSREIFRSPYFSAGISWHFWIKLLRQVDCPAVRSYTVVDLGIVSPSNTSTITVSFGRS